MKRLALPLLLLFVLFTRPAIAAMISVNVATPSGNIIIDQLTENGVEDIRLRSAVQSSTGTRDLRQTFTTPAAAQNWQVEAISFLFLQDFAADSSLSNTNLNMLVDIFSTTGVNDGAGTGSLMGGGETGLATFANNQQLWMTFTLANPVTLNPSTVYGMKIHFGSISNSSPRHEISNIYYFEGEADSGGPYAGGRMFRFRPLNDAGWDPDTDLAFVIQGQQVPEPSAFALAGMAVLGLVGCGLRRQVG